MAGILKNCLIYNNTNSSTSGGGGINVLNIASNIGYGVGAILNCTVVSNRAATSGGGIFAIGDSNAVKNCIFYDNSAANSNDVCNEIESNTNNYWNCCAPTNLPLDQGNIINNPLFKDFAGGNYRLNANSPCVNRGTNQDWMTNSYDLDGRTRIRYGTVDMGAYETIYEGTIYRVGF